MLPLFAAVLIGSPAVFGDEWEEVQRILAGTRDVVVLDGVETAPVRSTGTAAPEYGDWLVRHFLSDPESFNPFTSSDAGASSVRDYIFESLLAPRREPPYELAGLIAEGYPEVGGDHLKYTFDIREGVHFSDGTPLTAADVPLQHEGDPASGSACPPSAQLFQLGQRRPYRRGIPHLFLLQGAVLPQRPDAGGVQHHPEALLRFRRASRSGLHQQSDRWNLGTEGARRVRAGVRPALQPGLQPRGAWIRALYRGGFRARRRHPAEGRAHPQPELLGPGQGCRSGIRTCGQDRLQGHQQHRCRFHRVDQRQSRPVRSAAAGVQGKELDCRVSAAFPEGHPVRRRLHLHRVEQRSPPVWRQTGAPGNELSHRPPEHDRQPAFRPG